MSVPTGPDLAIDLPGRAPTGAAPAGTTEGRSAAAAGHAAVRAFVAEQWAQLYRTAYFLTGDRQDAEDAVQHAMAVVVERWDRIQRQDAPAAYARRVVATEVVRRSRRRRMEASRLADAGRGTAAGAPDHAQLVGVRDELVTALARLSPRMRAAVVLRHYGDLSEHETAAVLGCSVGTVKSQTSKGLARLRGLLADGRHA